MKILMLVEYFPPFDFGGSEWSSYYLAKSLSRSKCDVTILTPNYGNSGKQGKNPFEVIRFPFYKKIINHKQLTPFWQSNILWFLWTIVYVFKYCLKNEVDIIHVQGKYFLPAALLSKFVLGKKVIITLRDYIILCPLGTCFLKDKKSCNWINFLRYEIRDHSLIYHKGKNPIFKILIMLSSIRNIFISRVLKILLNFVDYKIAISKILKDIYNINGVSKIDIVVNPFEFTTNKSVGKNNYIVFAGRLTPGKGIKLLIESIPTVLKKYRNIKLLIFGEGFLKNELIKRINELKINNSVKFMGYVGHTHLMQFIKKSLLTVTPSIWPEPFGRLPLESLAMGTPVVVSKHAGIANYIQDKRWGRVVVPTSQKIAQGIIFILKNHRRIISNMVSDYPYIKKQFSEDIIQEYLKIYSKIL